MAVEKLINELANHGQPNPVSSQHLAYEEYGDCWDEDYGSDDGMDEPKKRPVTLDKLSESINLRLSTLWVQRMKLAVGFGLRDSGSPLRALALQRVVLELIFGHLKPCEAPLQSVQLKYAAAFQGPEGPQHYFILGLAKDSIEPKFGGERKLGCYDGGMETGVSYCCPMGVFKEPEGAESTLKAAIKKLQPMLPMDVKPKPNTWGNVQHVCEVGWNAVGSAHCG